MHSQTASFFLAAAGLLSRVSAAPQAAAATPPPASTNLTVTGVQFTFLPSNYSYSDDYLSSNSTNDTFDSYDTYYDSYINFTLSDPQSSVPSTTCSGTFWNTINDTACANKSYSFQLGAYFPEFWTLNVSHTANQKTPQAVVVRSATWSVRIEHPRGFQTEYDVFGNTTTMFKYNTTLSSAPRSAAAPAGWTGDADV